ncbi:phenylalanyl-tRNA synthetase beta subunit [Desulfacinum hydrothermale DSM 13146]|uniref:Phenylalanine--tRNA ligase beta subunit n=1 Tax=Desulfacinum hydrothermale DSM 13146 TaxID=1121390 RepID=A0A1W1XVM4_9BACT|nr:phenylalanine--tRNA ligase subunit beta [Desulfacinum hydrothermale]SMC27588.1 phenylalanyl-tRNA synthetase beta subunit [Desulfacinum hydrothermale DSM 13146]
MLVSTQWLKDYVDFTMDADTLAHRLTMAGLEVEAVERPYAFLQQVVVARVDAVEPHPNADKLRLCQVFDGSRVRQVVCGAPNVASGQVVPLALPGAVLPSGQKLAKAKIRGQVSEGMLCSQRELLLGDDASGIWVLDPALPLGKTLLEALDLDDAILDVSITPNRGDCLSMIGVAREVAALSGTRVRYPEISLDETGPSIHEAASVTLEDPLGCPRYAARLIRGVRIGPSPRWMQRRLEAAGIRSINNVVDVTNFVMLEMGQPLHAFDYERLREGRIVVRRAQAGERFSTLDGVERTLFDDTLLICDGVGPVAIAGIMGGLDSEITEGTTQVLIESAYFQPERIRRSSRKLGLRTESSYRFERGIDPEGVPRALDRAAQLMLQLAGGVLATGAIDQYPSPLERPTISLRVPRVNRFLGLDLDAATMAKVLESIEMHVEQADSETLRVTPPSCRHDVTREVDLAEEVVRLVGYDQVPVTHAAAPLYADPPDPHASLRLQVKQALTALGFDEVVTYSFISEKGVKDLGLPEGDARLRPVRLRNPLSEEQAVMRTSLLPGMLTTARHNFDRGNLDLRLFELSKVFLPRPDQSLPQEDHHLAGLLAGRRVPHLLYGSEETVDYADAKGAVEAVLECFHLGSDTVRFSLEPLPPYCDPAVGAAVLVEDHLVGSVGRVDPDVQDAFDLKRDAYYFELDFEELFRLKRPHPGFSPLPKFPAVARDMALIVTDDLPVAAPLDFIRSLNEPLVEQVDVFDLYRGKQLGEGRKSVGYRLVYRAPDRNLTDEEVNALHQRITEKVLSAFQAQLR